MSIAADLVAHRGYPLRYPENTLPGLQAAINAGACYLEFDIQLSRDHIPVLCHDADLQRTASQAKTVMELDSADLDQIDVGEPARFADRYKGTFIPRLSHVLKLISDHPEIQAFVEIKQESLTHFGIPAVMQPVIALLSQYIQQCTVISFNYDCLHYARQFCRNRVGWAIEQTDTTSLDKLKSLHPEFVFTSDQAFSHLYSVLSGPWRWVVYQTSSPVRARELLTMGADLVETDAIVEMLQKRNLE